MTDDKSLLEKLVDLDSIDKVISSTMTRGTGMDSYNAQSVVAACMIIGLRRIDGTLRQLDKATNRLQWISIGLGALALIVTVVSVLTTAF